MSFDLKVFVPPLPRDLVSRWQVALSKEGLACEFWPGFSTDTWAQGGSYPFKVRVLRRSFPHADRYRSRPLLAYVYTHLIELEDDSYLERASARVRGKLMRATHEAFFSTSAGRSFLQKRLQWFLGATLAALTRGALLDPQEGKYFTGIAAIRRAAEAAASDEPGPSWPGWKALAPFPGWEAVEVL